ncbi:MAG: hypothetical protein KY410_11070, partial [Proteobacteria bacterium]|nr:hypothetical protein [Pseudomonadota bacterium]
MNLPISNLLLQKAARDVECTGNGPGVRAVVFALFATAMLTVSACGGGGGGGGGAMDPGGGYGGGGDGGDGGGDGDTLVATLDSIQDNVFTPICTQCHTGASAPQGLRLEEGVSYGMLVNVASTEVPSLLRVEPGNPDDSYLIQKLEGTAAVGDRMPLGGPYLPQADIDVIRQWITDGASETATVMTSPSTKTQFTAGWPVADSTMSEGPSRITLIADGELDLSTLHGGTVELVRLGDTLGDTDPQTQKARAMNVDLEVSSLAPTVLHLRTDAAAFEPGDYEVRVKGAGAMQVADRAGFVIDGDADGEPGGDFILRFSVGDSAGDQ